MNQELQSYLDSCRAEGVLDSSGLFSLDLGKAREKLAAFFGPGRAHYLHFALRSALACRPAEIRVREGQTLVELEFDGEPPCEDQLRTLFGQPSLGLRVLQMALVGALEQGCSSMELRTPRRRARFTATGESFEACQDALANRLSFPRTAPARRLPQWLGRSPGELSKILARDFAWCLTPLRLGERPWEPKKLAGLSRLASNCPLPVAALSWPSPTTPPMAVGLKTGAPVPGSLSWLCQGATMWEGADPHLPPNLHLVVDLPLPLDLSLGQPVQDWAPPTDKLTALAASLVCRALLERPEWLCADCLLIADWVLGTLMIREQNGMALALAGQIWESGLLSRPDWPSAALLERLSYLQARLPEAPPWATPLEDRRVAAWNHLCHNPDWSQGRWRALSRRGWPLYPDCPPLAAACAELDPELACGLVKAWVRDTSGSQDRRQTELLRMLLRPETDDFEFKRARWPHLHYLLAAREMLFLADGSFPEASHDRVEFCIHVMFGLLESKQPGALRGAGLELARRLGEGLLRWGCPAAGAVAGPPQTQSAFLAALIDEPKRRAQALDRQSGRLLHLRFLLARTEYALGNLAGARAALANLTRDCLAARGATLHVVADFRTDLTKLLTAMEMSQELAGLARAPR